MIITEIQYFSSKIIRFQAIFKDTVEFTCALEFKISSQQMLFCNAGSRRRYCYLCGFLRYNFIPLFVFPVCLGSLPNFLHSSFRIMSHNEIMEKEFRKMVTPKAIPDILRYIIKLPDLSVVCKFDFQHLLLGIVPGRLDHGICPHYSLHLLFSLSHPACCHP